MDSSSPLAAASQDASALASQKQAVGRVHAHKFGGSSVADTDRIRHVAQLIESGPGPRVVVVSAMQGVTDALGALADAAGRGEEWQDAWSRLRDRHLATALQLDGEHAKQAVGWLDEAFSRLSEQLSRLAEASAGRGADPHEFAGVQGLGEVWSSYLMLSALGGEAAGWTRLDAREVLQVHAGELGVAVDWDATRTRLAEWRAQHPQRDVVVTGFVARDRDGRATTLGRNGSDYSGAIFAVLFDAVELTIWTDVDGVLSADPRMVPDAVCLPAMSYAEACELAYFGAKVLHPQTMAPAMQAGLPIVIRNSRNPDASGTRIVDGASAAAFVSVSPVKGLSLLTAMALIELSGAGLIGVPGTAERMFAALREAGVSVTMISQGSSEHSICCVVPAAQVERGRAAVEAAFVEAIADGQVEGVYVTGDIAVLAAVGDGMVGTPGVSARLFEGLARARVNVRAIAQGASERNISVAVSAADAVRALRAAHSAFWLSPATLSVGLIGPGNVGSALLAQLAEALPRFAAAPQMAHRLDLRLRAVASSRAMVLEDGDIDPTQAIAQLRAEAAEGLDLERFAAHVRADHLPHALIVDCSGSDAVAARYPEWLAMGLHIATPSKHAGSGDLARYRAIREAEKGGGTFRYEATVGAGLPVIQTLRMLLDTGDELLSIEGILSGTLAWLFNRYDGSAPFSQLVAEAKALGYTEPDPRDDLSGADVARKLVILAREAGRDLSLEDVEVENLVPEALRGLSREEFLARMHEMDAPMQARLEAARAEGRSLRYLARLGQDGSARVALATPEPGHASLHGGLTDNLIQFRTRRYATNPLVVQGPGAGADVTAGGVFGDILLIAQSLGARA